MSLKPEYAPINETSDQIWGEITHFVGDTVLGFFACGITFAIYIQCLIVLLPQIRTLTGTQSIIYSSRRKWALFHLIYCTLLWALVTLGTAATAHLAQIVFINNRNYPGGPLAFVAENTNLPILVLSWSSYTVAAWLQDAYVLYRFLIFWNWNYWICAFPITVFFGAVAASIGSFLQLIKPHQGIDSHIGTAFLSSWYILSVALNVIVTLAIVGRLLYKKRLITKLLGKRHSKLYTGVTAMLIESAALYSVFGLIYVGNYVRGKYTAHLFLPLLGNLEAICPLLIIYRVTNGAGWTQETSERISADDQGPLVFAPPTKRESFSGGIITRLTTNEKFDFKPSPSVEDTNSIHRPKPPIGGLLDTVQIEKAEIRSIDYTDPSLYSCDVEV